MAGVGVPDFGAFFSWSCCPDLLNGNSSIPPAPPPQGSHVFLLIQGSEGEKWSVLKFQLQQRPVRAGEGGTANQL